MKHQNHFKIDKIADAYYLITSDCNINFPLLANAILMDDNSEFKNVSASRDELCLSNDMDDYKLLKYLESINTRSANPQVQKLQVCFEKGADWNEVETLTNLSKEEYIQKMLLAKLYVSMTGFYPGFIYLEGLDECLWVPRKSVPRLEVEAGSFAVGGQYAGIYNLQSPGGWSIIGVCKLNLWDVNKSPPIAWNIGDTICIQRISEAEFEKKEQNLS